MIAVNVQVENFPDASETVEGRIVQYVGTESKYNRGHFYELTGGKWVELNFGTTIISTDGTIYTDEFATVEDINSMFN